MKPMSLAETKTVQGGAISGALLTGIAGLIEGFNVLVTNIGGMAFAFHNQYHIKGAVQFNKNFNFSWDDTKASQATLISSNKWTNAPSTQSGSSTPLWNFQ